MTRSVAELLAALDNATLRAARRTLGHDDVMLLDQSSDLATAAF